ncbi:prephenate dehydrogenase [Actinoplanes couchii]|uniref:Prephenate dehydrogenase n=1 Tax=Actinoplanes couchii TaxID=403638 RepID=A0ABQ3XIG2_9ACTN|nr:prephenate dehydrogenase/arogenate dehydrogenase family protein [Actinoplanes couchii]MDR6324729.1 prephenate dehydrogenase [Actinoplanes couchii]GID58286.1 prephenate dehydrogenase [Actinoplanes couchii]
MRIAVVGLGLIGGSLLRALAAAGHEVAGFDADPGTREQARAAGFRIAGSVPEAVAGSQVTVLAVPLPVLPRVIAGLNGYDGLVTDVTSVKGPVRELLTGRRFVGGHPMAGRETSGFAASDPGLFDGCAWVLCLEPDETALDDWLLLARLFTGMGARVVPVTAAEHDTAVARISHVPHLFAAVLAAQVGTDPLAGALAAGSFRDGTRVAATRAELTAAMCGGNRDAVRTELRRLIGELETLDGALDDAPSLISHLRPGETARRAWPPAATTGRSEMSEIPTLLALGRSGGWVTSVRDREVVTMRPKSDRNGS